MRIRLLLALLLAPSLASAAYLNQGETLRYEQDQAGVARLFVRFTGDAGEEIVDVPYLLTESFSFPLLQDWIAKTVVKLNGARTAGKDTKIDPGKGKKIAGLLLSSTAPTARMVWRRKADWYAQTCTNGFIGTIATECTALKADIEATYQAGFILGE
jgi:hypothetical protein